MRSLLIVGVVCTCVLLGTRPHSATAQSSKQSIIGQVVDSTGTAIPGATVVAMLAADSSLTSFGVTKSDGAFRLRRVPTGDYILQVTFVGYAPSTQNISVESETLDVGKLVIRESTEALDELTISAERIPMLVNSDTLVYNAGAFKVAPNSNVESLLKKLPGIEVERDGSIKALGETVENVYVDGKEFFGDDPKIATKNLPAEAVDKVQVYDKKSDMAEFTGIEDGEDAKTINLELKEDHKKGYFGNLEGGYGENNRYDGKANINRFSGDSQLSFIGNANNVNRQAFSFNDYVQFAGGLNSLFAYGGKLADVALGANTGGGNTTTASAGLNYNKDLGPNTSIRSSYFINSIDNVLDRTAQQLQILGADVSSRVDEVGNRQSGNLNNRLSLNASHEFRKGRDLRLRSNLQLTNSNTDDLNNRNTFAGTETLRSENTTDYSNEGHTLGGGATLTFRERLASSGRSFIAELGTDINESDSDGSLSSASTFYDAGVLNTMENLGQRSQTAGDNLTNRAKVSLIEPFGKRFSVESSYDWSRNVTKNVNDVFDVQNQTEQRISDLSSNLERRYQTHRVGATLAWNKPDKVKVSAGLRYQLAKLGGEIQDPGNLVISRHYNHVLPSASFNYDFRPGRSIALRYFTQTRAAQLQELNPAPNNRDPLNIFVGNPDLAPEYLHGVSGRYMLFDQFTFTNFFVHARATLTDNKIVRVRTLASDLSQSVTLRNEGEALQVQGGFNFGTPIRAIGSKIGLSNTSLLRRGIEFINAEENQTTTTSTEVDLKLGNRKKDVVDISAGTRISFNSNRYSLNPVLNQSYVNRSYYADLIFNYNDTWVLSATFDLQHYNGDVFGESRNVALLGAELTRNLMNGQAQVKLVGSDLFDQDLGVQFTNTATYIQEESVNTLGRYIMLKFVYKLSEFGGNQGVEINMK